MAGGVPQRSDSGELIRNGRHVPVLMLTVRADGVGRLEGFRSGADDCITKPFRSRKLNLPHPRNPAPLLPLDLTPKGSICSTSRPATRTTSSRARICCGVCRTDPDPGHP